MKTGITVHFRVRNEETYCEAALKSVLPLAERVLVFDTASTDSTLQKIKAIAKGDSCIEIHEVPATDAEGLCAYRNQMADMTKTEWYMIVDGDEIYPMECIEKIIEKMKAVPSNIDRIRVCRRHFYKSLNFISEFDGLGRIFRTATVRRTLHSTAKNCHGSGKTSHVGSG